MSMIETLFGLIPAASRGQQWVARDLQLVNWGGYDGYHHLRLAPGATLLSGGSGSGKSTLMDAYIALIMPHTTPFNGASNGGVVGRPRGKDQRNILSYARGKLDESRADGETKVRVLRGDGRDTWSAVAMTWVDHTGAAFTALRAWYVPSSARVLDDVVPCAPPGTTGTTCATWRPRRPAARPRRRHGDRLDLFDTDRDFTARLHTTLGIGAAGDGHKAVGAARPDPGRPADHHRRRAVQDDGAGGADHTGHRGRGGPAVRRAVRHPGADDHRRQQVKALTPIRGYRRPSTRR